MTALRQWTLSLVSLLFLLLGAPAQASDYITFLHADPQGSPIMATDEQGNVVWQEEYEPWGARQLKNPASATASRGSEVWYTGKEEEAALGMYYYGARWYLPGVGQFTATDPAAVTLNNPRSFNRYVYANNNPVRYVDPNGESPVDAVFLAYDIGNFAYAVYKGDGVGSAAVDVGLSVLGVLSPVPGAGQMLKTARTAERAVGVALAADHGRDVKRALEGAEEAGKSTLVARGAGKAVPDSAVVCRGGSCTADAFRNGSGVTQDAAGKLSGISTGIGDSVASASKNIPHNRVGVTTAGEIRKAGGTVVNDRGNHANVSGITAEKAAELFKNVVRNPNR